MKAYQVLNSSGNPASNDNDDLCIFETKELAQKYINYLSECVNEKNFKIKEVKIMGASPVSFIKSPPYNNELGDKCFADSLHVIKDDRKLILFAEVDGMHFDSSEYPTKKRWLQAIVNRVYSCAMGELD